MVSVGAMTMPGVADARGFVRGGFTVSVNLPTASLEDVGASACKLTVDATVTVDRRRRRCGGGDHRRP